MKSSRFPRDPPVQPATTRQWNTGKDGQLPQITKAHRHTQRGKRKREKERRLLGVVVDTNSFSLSGTLGTGAGGGGTSHLEQLPSTHIATSPGFSL